MPLGDEGSRQEQSGQGDGIILKWIAVQKLKKEITESSVKLKSDTRGGLNRLSAEMYVSRIRPPEVVPSVRSGEDGFPSTQTVSVLLALDVETWLS